MKPTKFTTKNCFEDTPTLKIQDFNRTIGRLRRFFFVVQNDNLFYKEQDQTADKSNTKQFNIFV